MLLEAAAAAAMTVAAASPSLLVNSSAGAQHNYYEQAALGATIAAAPEAEAAHTYIAAAAHGAISVVSTTKAMIVGEVLFPNKYVVDDREPQFVLSVPATSAVMTSSFDFGAGASAADNSSLYGITSFDPFFWLQSIFLVCLQTAFNVCVAIFVYKYIVTKVNSKNDVQNQPDPKSTSSQPTINNQQLKAYMIGYGFIIPMLLCVPWLGIKLLDLQNIAFILLVAGATPSLLILRCMEAMHGTLPQFASENYWNFILYYATTLGFQFNFDTKTHQIVKVTRQEFVGRTIKFVRLFLFSTVCYSVLLPCQCKLFPSKPIHSIIDTLYYGNLLNNLVIAALFIVCLDTGSTGLGLVASLLTGYSTTQMNDRPLIASQSPSEFWGKRWNRIFAGCLKSGIYMPARRQFKCSKTISAMLTFLVSGLLHEYILLLIMSSSGNVQQQYQHQQRQQQYVYIPNFGNQLLFFAWSGIVLMMEGWVVKKHPNATKWMNHNLAQPIRTTLTMMTALPLLHWFMDEYVACGLFQHVALGFPKIVYLGKSE